MIIALVLLNAGLLLTLLGGVFYVRKTVIRWRNNISSAYIDYITPESDNIPSKAVQTIDNAATVFTQRAMTIIQAKGMASASQIARQENAIAKDMIEDVATKANPIMGMFLKQFPSVGKRLAKNPSAFAALLPMIQGMTKRGPGNGHVDNSWMDQIGKE